MKTDDFVLLFSLLFSSRIFSSVEGNNEIEYCVRFLSLIAQWAIISTVGAL